MNAPLLASSLPDRPNVLESIVYQFNGLVLVFIALGSIWLLMELTGAMFKKADAQKKAKAAAQAAQLTQTKPTASGAGGSAPSSSDAGGIDPAVLAVIAAAVHVTLGSSLYRVVGVAREMEDPTWAREGRREIFASHKVR